jgi:FixJ family two-component response regulator
MTQRILFVDDEKYVLDTFRRNFIFTFYLDTAESSASAIQKLESEDDWAVIVADMRMPHMNGAELLAEVKQRWPHIVRIMLTGYADIDNAMKAVNQGEVFRFLLKPCPPETLSRALENALEQHRLITAEKQLLHGTLRGCVQVMSELLELANPLAYGRGERAKPLVLSMAKFLGAKNIWKYELATMLSQIGCLSLPQEILERRIQGKSLSAEEEQIFLMHPAIAGNLLRNLPRLEEVAAMVSDQEAPLEKNPPSEHVSSKLPWTIQTLRPETKRQLSWTTCAIIQNATTPKFSQPLNGAWPQPDSRPWNGFPLRNYAKACLWQNRSQPNVAKSLCAKDKPFPRLPLNASSSPMSWASVNPSQ